MITIGLVAAVGLASGCREPRAAAKPPAPAAQAVEPAGAAAMPTAVASAAATVEVRRETLRRYAPAVGNFRARQTTKVGPQISGRVQDVLVEVGDVVSKGQVLVRLDPTFFEIGVQQAQAAVEAETGALGSAAADVTNTEREMRRQLDLFDRSAGSPKERDDAVTAYERAVATRVEKAGKLSEAQKRLAYAQEQLEETTIRAPYDGAITARMVDPGEPAMTMPPTHLVEIQEVGVLHLEFSLPQELLSVVRAGTVVDFEVEGVHDGAGSGTVAVVFPAIDELTRAFRCRVVIENEARKYQPGLLANVRVVTQEEKDTLVVPRGALAQTSAGWQAIVTVEGRRVAKPVQVGLMTDQWAQVTGGLSEGELILAVPSGRS